MTRQHERNGYAPHPLSQDYPLMPDADVRAMAADMEAHGYDARFPVVLHEGKVLDGRNRQTAAKLAGVEPVYVELPKGQDAAAFVERANEHRRHLSQEWLAKRREERVAKVAEMKQEGNSNRAIAEAVGVSEVQVRRDLERASATAPPGAVEPPAGKVTGKDGKKRDARKKKRRTPAQVAADEAKAVQAAAAQEASVESDTPGDAGDADSAPTLDDVGVPVQAHAEEAFAARPMFDELEAALVECRRLYARLASHPGGAYLLRPGVSVNDRKAWRHAGIENAILAVRDCRPSLTFCPYAHNPDHEHPEDCTLCHGLNWTRPLERGRVPEELMRNAKEALGA